MEPATSIIKEELQIYFSSAYPALWREYMLFLLAMAAACAVIPLFTVWVLSRRDHKRAGKGEPCKAYTHRESVGMVHLLFTAALPLLAARKLWLALGNRAAYGPWLIGAAACLLALAVWAAYRFWRWRVSGMFAAGGFVLGYAALEQCLFLRAAAEVFHTQEAQTEIVRYAWYIQLDYITTWAMAACALALAVLVFLAVYCYRRRFLFLPGKLAGARCANCGQLTGGDSVFCTHCGQQLPQEPAPVRPAALSLDKEIFCKTCGDRLLKSSCPVCDRASDRSKILKNAGREAGRGAIGNLRYAALTAAAIVVFTGIPGKLSPLIHLTKGSVRVYNAFVQQLNELREDPEKASDAEWLAGFDSAAGALYTLDARWLYVEPRGVPYEELMALPAYAEAAFLRMGVVERISEAVHAGPEDAVLVSLRNDLDATMQLEASALSGRLHSVGCIEKVERMALDAARTILQKVRCNWLSAAVLALCGAMCIGMLNRISGSWEAGPCRLECRLWNARDKAGSRIKRFAPWNDTLRDTALGRAATVGRGLLCCLLRTGNELWLLVLHLAGTVGLFLSVFRWRNLQGLFQWVRDGLTDGSCTHSSPSAACRRTKRAVSVWLAAVVLVIVAALTGYGFYLASAGEMDETAYLSAAKAAVSDYAEQITSAVQDIRTDGILTEEDRERLYGLLRAQAEADRAVLDMDPAALEELEDMKALHAGLCSLCTDDLAALKRIQAALEAGQAPSQELLDHYIRLRGENYLWIMQEFFEALVVFGVKSAAS